jgi:choline kinase
VVSTKTAVILVAGTGSRLHEFGRDQPKSLLEVGGETILGRALRILMDYGVERVVLATGYKEGAVRAAVRRSPIEVTLCFNDRYASTQNCVSLARCSSVVHGQAFFKLDGDVIFDARVLPRLDGSSSELAVAVNRAAKLDPETMKVTVEAGDRISSFGKHIPLSRAVGESIGIERLSSRASERLFKGLARAVELGRSDLYYEDIYSELISKGELRAEAVDVSDLDWVEIDTPEDLRRARIQFESRR